MRSSTPSVDIVMAGTFAAWRLGTLQARALPLARGLQAHGLRAAIVTVPWDMPTERGVLDAVSGVEIHNTRGSQTSTIPLTVVQQARHIRALRPRAVHVFKPKGYGGLAGRLVSPTTSLVIDSDDWEGDGGWNQAGDYSVLQRRLFAWQERNLLRTADAVTAASLLLKRKASRLRNQRPDDVSWIPNGLDPAWAQQLATARSNGSNVNADANEYVIVMYSRFAEFPVDWLPRYLSVLSSRLPTDWIVRFITVGDNPVHGGRFHNLRLEHMGYVAHDRIPSLLADAQIALFPYVDSLISRSKNSVKLLELMASGCAVIASDIGDVPAVAGDTVVLVSRDSPDAFADATLDLARQRDRIRRLSSMAQKRAITTFELPAITGRLVDAYAGAGVVRP